MELELIDYLRQRLPPHPALRLGIGDDAAVVRLGGDECVVTTDVVMDGVDFRLEEVDPRRVGRKALAINLSDLAAMAARPVAAVVGLVLPRRGGLELAKQLFEGLLPLAEKYDVAIAGGDTNSWNGPLVVSVTAIGAVTEHGVWTRSGARPGDAILVTGTLGGSILGKHFDFEPRVSEALRLATRHRVTAAIDISDGLLLDLSRLAEASGCGAELRLDAVPVSDAAKHLAATTRDGKSALDHACGDGEDFELLLTAPPDVVDRMVADRTIGVPIRPIGVMVPEPGLWAANGTGSRQPLTPRGYVH